jgi:hypothetical protein
VKGEKFGLPLITFPIVPVAQPDRASDFGSEGWGFESLQARGILQGTYAYCDSFKKKRVCHLLATFKAKGLDSPRAVLLALRCVR